MAPNYVASPMSRADIRHIAKCFREMLGLKDVLYVDVVRLLEFVLAKLGVNYEVVGVSELKEEAVSHPATDTIIIREDVYSGACQGVGRYRFTIMHEIAHLLLHDTQSIRLARGEKPREAYLDPEWQADAFAGEFLVPYSLTCNMTEKEIVEKCGVTPRAAKCQIKAQKR